MAMRNGCGAVVLLAIAVLGLGARRCGAERLLDGVAQLADAVPCSAEIGIGSPSPSAKAS